MQKWEPRQHARPTKEQILSEFGNGAGIGIVSGAVSSDLEIIDVDNRDSFTEFVNILLMSGAEELFMSLPIVQTPNGYHLYYRCEVIEGNQKLAQRPLADKKRKTLIETRGEGGYVLAPGSPVECHPDKGSYTLIQGHLESIPTIDTEQRQQLLDAARSLNEYVKVQDPVAKVVKSDDGFVDVNTGRPGDDYIERTPWSEVLTGWQHIGQRQDSVDLWRRPGKTTGISATTNYAGTDLLYVFSSNGAPFEPERGYSKFSAYGLLNHGGDFKAASIALKKLGFGTPPATESPVGLTDWSAKYGYKAGSQACAGAYYVDAFKDQLRFVTPEDKWYHYDGIKWSIDETRRFKERAKSMYRKIEGELEHTAYEQREAMGKLAGTMQTVSGINATVEMAASDANIQERSDSFDSNDTNHLLNTRAGVIDMKAGVTHPHESKFLITKFIDWTPDYSKEPTEFLQWLDAMFPNDPQVTAWLVYYMAYCLTGETGFQKFLMMTGEAGSGKSQIQNLMNALAPDYYCAISAESLRATNQRSAGADSDLARIRGARMVSASELSDKQKLDEQLINALVGGDAITVKLMRENRTPLKVNAKLMFTANERPPLSDNKGIARRLLELRFEHVVKNPVASYANKLMEREGPQILGFLLKAAHQLYRTNFEGLYTIPESIQIASADYVDEADIAKQFESAAITAFAGNHVTSAAMFDCYEEYCKNQREPVEFSKRALCRRLVKMGYKPGKSATGQRGFRDIAVS